jgi:hypothetical protein
MDTGGLILTSAPVSITVGTLPPIAEWFPLDEGAINTNTNQTHSADSVYTGYFSNGVAASPVWITNNLPPVPAVLGGTVAAVNFNAAASTSTDPYITTTYPGVQGTNARTITAWINASNIQPNSASILSYGSIGTGQRMTLRLDTTNVLHPDVLRLEVQGAAAAGTTSLNDGKWHHVAAIVPGNSTVANIQLYVDGNAETVTPVNGTTAINTINTSSIQDVMLGNSAVNTNTYGFNGSVDDVRFFTNVLTATQVGELVFGQYPTNAPLTLPTEALTLSQQPGNLTLSWPGNWVLQTNSVLDGSLPWGDVPNSFSPYTVPLSPAGMLFFRLQSP